MANQRKVEKAIREGRHPRHTIPAGLEQAMGRKTRQGRSEPPATAKRARHGGPRAGARPDAARRNRFG
jgi:hypothetical protein